MAPPTPLFADDAERATARALAELAHGNPFLPRRVELEREVLGGTFVEHHAVWHPGDDDTEPNPNLEPLAELAERLVGGLYARLTEGARPGRRDALLYRDVVHYLLYERHRLAFFRALSGDADRRSFPSFPRFEQEVGRLLAPVAGPLGGPPDAAHLFACFFQVRRAFHFIFHFILGSSLATASLRAEVWNSIFGRDLRRYYRSLYRRMGDVTTLIVGPSGTGKELVARAIALARYLPFSANERSFAGDFEQTFFPLNLSALSPTLIESELFGHRRGAFTGAVEDRKGWLEVCPPQGTVFLDEIGDLQPSLQVKLLRVLESRAFQRLGETRSREFPGKVVAATHRDLGREMRDGRFRADLYYRLCGDTVRVPSLAERLRGAPQELGDLVHFLARQIAGPEEAASLAQEVLSWIEDRIGQDYDWPGNVRELGQCVRNVMVRGRYEPAGKDQDVLPAGRLGAQVAAGKLTAEELLARYVALVYDQAGSYQEAGRRLQLDRRTVKSKLDRGFLRELRGESRNPRGET